MYTMMVLPAEATSPRVGPFHWSGPDDDPETWSACAVQLAAGALGGSPSYEAHIIVDAHDAAWISDVGSFRDIVRRARESTWGADLYLTIDGSPVLEQDLAEAVGHLLDEAVAEGLSDVLEVPPPPPFRHVSPETLRSAVRRSVLRRRMAPLLAASGEEWCCLVPPERSVTKALFGRYAASPWCRPGGAVGMLLRRLEDFERGPRFVLAPEPIKGHLERQNPGLLVAPHRGDIEAAAFMRLVSRRDRAHVLAHPAERPGKVVRVEAVRPRLFDRSDPTHDRIVVATSCVPPGPLRDACQVAAREVGQIVRERRRHSELYCHPAMTMDGFLELRRHQAQAANIWVYLGEGHTDDGLQDADGQYYRAERWLDAWSVSGTSTFVALFSSSRSARVAEAFVAARAAQVAIGFEGDIRPSDREKLSVGVVRAAMHQGTEESILDAFHQGVLAIRALVGHDPCPVAYVPA
jgi:hypothetical protein